MKIPTDWFHLHLGDRIHCRQPQHVIRKALVSMSAKGWEFDLIESPTGFWLACTKSPLVSPYVPEATNAPQS